LARTVIRPNPEGIAALHRHVERVHDSVVDDVYNDAVRHAAVDTGEMLATMHRRRVRPLLSQVVVGSDHWKWVEYDTKAHDIRPRDPSRALFWPGAPHPVRVVHHPGTTEQPFMRPAVYQRRSLAGRPWR